MGGPRSGVGGPRFWLFGNLVWATEKPITTQVSDARSILCIEPMHMMYKTRSLVSPGVPVNPYPRWAGNRGRDSRKNTKNQRFGASRYLSGRLTPRRGVGHPRATSTSLKGYYQWNKMSKILKKIIVGVVGSFFLLPDGFQTNYNGIGGVSIKLAPL